MNAKTRWLIVALAGVSVVAGGTVWAQSGGGYDASVNTFDAGGGRTSGGGFVLNSAVGQPIAGTSSGASFSLNAGIIAKQGAGTPVPPSGPYKGYAPQVASDGVH